MSRPGGTVQGSCNERAAMVVVVVVGGGGGGGFAGCKLRGMGELNLEPLAFSVAQNHHMHHVTLSLLRSLLQK